jgi:anti-sigma factor RsiW
MKCEEVHELIEAFHDDELSAETRSAVAGHLTSCAPCAASLAQLDLLSTAIRGVGPFSAPDSLRTTVKNSLVRAQRDKEVTRQRWRWGAFAASHVGALLLGGLLAYALLNDRFVESFDVRDVVSAHVRSLTDMPPVQVASSDTHTVRPWFAGKLDFSPPVENFTHDGFPLLGARIDYVGGAKTAALVYGRNKHIINVFVSAANTRENKPAKIYDKNGFAIVEWQTGDLWYRAISDINAAELADLARRLGATFPS